jgi:hypothetical protein
MNLVAGLRRLFLLFLCQFRSITTHNHGHINNNYLPASEQQ